MSTSTTGVIVVLIASPQSASDKLARSLIESRLAACVNCMPGVRSTYRWEGKVEVDTEDLLVVKTTKEAFPRLEELVKKEHPYDVPEIIGMDVPVGSKDYLSWVKENVV